MLPDLNKQFPLICKENYRLEFLKVLMGKVLYF